MDDDERRTIFRLLNAKVPVAAIARRFAGDLIWINTPNIFQAHD